MRVASECDTERGGLRKVVFHFLNALSQTQCRLVDQLRTPVDSIKNIGARDLRQPPERPNVFLEVVFEAFIDRVETGTISEVFRKIRRRIFLF